jgi:beta-lactam-binding protein with PASTA domain
MICAVGLRHRAVLASCGVLAAACFLAACGNAPAPRAAPTTSTSTTTSSTTTTTTTTLPPGVAVPNVVGMKIDLARFYLWTAGFVTVPLTPPCSKGTPISQSVVASLAVPGKPPDVTVGAQPLVPGTLLDKGALVGITWSGCYPAGTEVPQVVGHTFANAVRLLHLAGLNWACFSVGGPTTTTTTSAGRPAASSTTTTAAPRANEAAAAPQPVVITQGTKEGTLVQAGTVVDILMHRCPQ